MESDDSDDDIPLAQRNIAPVKAEPPQAKVKPEPSPAKVKPEPAEKRKAEAKAADPVEKKQKAAPTAKKPAPTSNGSDKRKASENGGRAKQRRIADDDESEEEEEDDDDDADEDEDEDDDYDDDTAKKAKSSKAAPKAKASLASKPTAAANGSTPKKPPAKAKSPKKPAAKAKTEPADKSSALQVLESSTGGERWYETGEEVEWKRGGEKWLKLQHNGVMFPPLYEPHGVPIVYEGIDVKLPPACEEVATMFAAMKDTAYATKETFQKNFMNDWRRLLKQHEGVKHIKYFNKCSFVKIAEHLATLSEQKKQMTSEQKKAAKAEKDKLEEPFAFAIVDGRKEKLGNFRVEPPGLFRGRGEHPKMGHLKARIYPEDITINLSEEAEVPPVPDIGDGKRHKWGEIVHKNTVTWLCKWKDSINGEDKCVWLSANSSWKGMSDMAKYEKARKLKDHIDKVRKDYEADMKSSDLERQQKGVAVYLIDRLALRVGGEKDTGEEADTVGCCSLRVEHVKDDAGENKLHLNFLGKDSIEYDNTTEVTHTVYKLIKEFMKKKKPSDQLFETIVPSKLNDYFHEVMEGLSAKVFRTYNASITLCSELQKTDREVLQDRIDKEGHENAYYTWYNIANKNVAELCNHQKAASPAHEAAMAKMREKIEGLEVEFKEAKKSNPSRAEQLQKRIEKARVEMEQKDRLKNVSLGTSKINYNDPRITVAWCKRFDVPIHKPFPKTLLSKFSWAMNVSPDYRF